jgi:hypothetical protein
LFLVFMLPFVLFQVSPVHIAATTLATLCAGAENPASDVSATRLRVRNCANVIYDVEDPK